MLKWQNSSVFTGISDGKILWTELLIRDGVFDRILFHERRKGPATIIIKILNRSPSLPSHATLTGGTVLLCGAPIWTTIFNNIPSQQKNKPNRFLWDEYITIIDEAICILCEYLVLAMASSRKNCSTGNVRPSDSKVHFEKCEREICDWLNYNIYIFKGALSVILLYGI